MLDGLLNYHKFYREILKKIAKNAIKDGVRIVEIRHFSGFLFNDNWGKIYNETIDGKIGMAWFTATPETLSLKDEFELYKEVLKEIQKDDPYFEFAIIPIGLRSLSHEFAIEQIKSYEFALDNRYDFITGFDLVDFEDKFKPIFYFKDEIIEAKDKYHNFDVIFHAGETTSRYNENFYDALLF